MVLRSLFCALIASQICGGASRAVARTLPVARASAAHAEHAARARLPQVPPAGRGRRRGAHLEPHAATARLIERVRAGFGVSFSFVRRNVARNYAYTSTYLFVRQQWYLMFITSIL